MIIEKTTREKQCVIAYLIFACYLEITMPPIDLYFKKSTELEIINQNICLNLNFILKIIETILKNTIHSGTIKNTD